METIEKIMVFKEANELPVCFKFLTDYIPQPKEQVVVLNQRQDGEEIYLQVRTFNTTKIKSVLNSRHFRTRAQHKLRERLLKLPKTENIDKLLKTL